MSNFKHEASNPTQRTLTAFITRPSGDQTTSTSDALCSVPASSLSNGHELVIGACREEEEENYGDCSLEKSRAKCGHDEKEPMARRNIDTAIRNRILQNDLSNSDNIASNPAPPHTPPSVKNYLVNKSPGSVQARLEDIIIRRNSRDDFVQEAGPSRDGVNSVESSEPSWEELQSGYDSHNEQVWKDNQCALCGAEVNEWLPTARQEHEDFHFAMWLQEQEEEGLGGFQRSTVTTTGQTEKSPR
jgi:hypothetical protein